MNLLKIHYTALLLVLAAISLNAGATIAEPGLSASSNGDNVFVTWQTLEETNLKHFIVQRSTQKYGTFTDIGIVLPEKDMYYEFIDETAYKTSGTIYYYRVAIVETDGDVTYSDEVTVLHDNISGVKKTWGSIKALFR